MRLWILIGCLCLFTANCGTIKVESDTVSDAVDKIIDAAGEDSTDTNPVATGTDSEGTTHTFDSDTADAGDRYFIGTFTEQYAYQNCADFPKVIRLYSHNNLVDLEDNSQNRIGTGVQFPDDTFDFTVTYLDSLGNPDIDLSCTCSITVEQYYADELDCDCDSDKMNDCSLFYEKVE